ncbi:MAG: DUF721 domain-containing protein [Candidatus Omnitrophota bacterium]
MKTERHVKSVIEGLLRKIGENAHKKGTPIIDAWREINNNDLKKNAQVISLKKGTLIVEVGSSAWLYKFTLEKEKIKNEFNDKYKSKRKIKDIRFRIGSLEE